MYDTLLGENKKKGCFDNKINESVAPVHIQEWITGYIYMYIIIV